MTLRVDELGRELLESIYLAPATSEVARPG